MHGSRGIRGRSPVSQRWTVGTNHKYKAVWDWINGQTLAGPSTAPSMFPRSGRVANRAEPNCVYAVKAATDTIANCCHRSRRVAHSAQHGLGIRGRVRNTGHRHVDKTGRGRIGQGHLHRWRQWWWIRPTRGAGTERYGGGGGGGGGIAMAEFPAAALNSTEFCWVGAGGAGGAAQTTNDTNGNPGSTGYPSAFGCVDNTLAGSTATGTKLKTAAGIPAGGGTTSAGARARAERAFPIWPRCIRDRQAERDPTVRDRGDGLGYSLPGRRWRRRHQRQQRKCRGRCRWLDGLSLGLGPMTQYVGGAGGAAGLPGESGSHASTPRPDRAAVAVVAVAVLVVLVASTGPAAVAVAHRSTGRPQCRRRWG